MTDYLKERQKYEHLNKLLDVEIKYAQLEAGRNAIAIRGLLDSQDYIHKQIEACINKKRELMYDFDSIQARHDIYIESMVDKEVKK